MRDAEDRSLEALVEALPEVYQPIFGHEQFTSRSSRPCHDRLEVITAIHSQLEKHLERPLRVLDLGCAQGFFSLSLAASGASVKGIDFCPENIAVCQRLARSNPALRVEFQLGNIEETVESLALEEFDLVLCLSVLHHVVHDHGADFVRGLIARIADLTTAGIFELALSSEPLYWAAAQADDPRSLLSAYAFVHETRRVTTHLSSDERPMYFASNQFWYFDGHSDRFDRWTDKSHRLVGDAHCGTRRYFFSTDKVVKQSLINASHLDDLNLLEIRNERQVLQRSDLPIKTPRLILSGENQSEAWLVRSFIEGKLLVDLICDGEAFDREYMIAKILEQLSDLEELGLYHSDLRTWNILVLPEGEPVVFDYGSISSDRKDNCWPTDLLLNFYLFINEVFRTKCSEPTLGRPPFISPHRLPSPHREKYESFWDHAVNCWSFRAMKDHIENFDSTKSEARPLSAQQLWMLAMEDRLGEMTEHSARLLQCLNDTEERLTLLQHRLTTMESSRSWRLTAPLRRLAATLRQLRQD